MLQAQDLSQRPDIVYNLRLSSRRQPSVVTAWNATGYWALLVPLLLEGVVVKDRVPLANQLPRDLRGYCLRRSPEVPGHWH
jgi:hypothetical protein